MGGGGSQNHIHLENIEKSKLKIQTGTVYAN